MENASNALIIAGSVLFAIIIMGGLLYLYNNVTQYPQQQEIQLKLEQVAKFNAEYELYNKKQMYGTDVVTVLNKAINNNQKDSATEDDIDVQITLLKDISAYAEEYTVNGDDYSADITRVDKGTYKNGSETYELGIVLEGNKTYSLLRNYKEISKILIGVETIKIPAKDNPQFNYTLIYSGFRDFVRKYFECTSVEYDAQTGKVNKLVFTEIDNSN